MERSLFTFIIAATAFFFVYMTLRVMFVPPPPPPAVEELADGEVVDPENVDSVASNDSDSSDETVPEANAGDGSEEKPKARSAQRWMTLGSMDASTGHNMLVTLSNKGGGVERIELTERRDGGGLKYRRVDVRHGYLGYFAGGSVMDVDGVLVNVVGPGTPADAAGVQVGDVIVAIGGQVIVSRNDIEAALLKTKPGDQISVEVLRTAAAAAGDDEADEDAGNAAAPTRGPPVTLTATLTEHPLDLIRLARDGGADQVVGNLSRLSCLMTLGQVNRKRIITGQRGISGLSDPTELNWEYAGRDTPEKSEASFTLDLSAAEMEPIGGQPVRLSRRYSLVPGSYVIDMSVQVENTGTQPQDLAYRLEGANGLTLEGWWYSNKISPNFGGAAARDVVYRTAAEGHELISGYDLLKKAKNEPEKPDQSIFAPDASEEARDLKYIGVDAQYFDVGYIPAAGETSLSGFRRATANVVADPSKIERHKERAVNVSFFLDSSVATVGPGKAIRKDLQLFAGPKQPELLAKHGLGDSIYYGWFALFARLLAGLLHILSGVGNYAVAIIILTVIVRGAMFPLSRKAAVNAQRMQELAPELKKIADQYKDDMEGRLKAQRELQQRVGFNPLAGCLPMFLQLPIFIGLYRALSVDIELRQEAVSSSTAWASNLAGPDMFLYWGDWLWDYLSGRGTGWLGPYFNILPVIVVTLFLAQQKMFMPPATDEQTAMTQKMMTVMTMMMGLFFFRVPAGLCIYFITSSLWGICERILVKKTLPKTPHFDASVIEGTATATDKKKSPSLTDRIREQVTKPEEPAERPNKRRRPPNKKKK